MKASKIAVLLFVLMFALSEIFGQEMKKMEMPATDAAKIDSMQTMAKPAMKCNCMAMMEKQQKMMEQMKAMDERLDAKLAVMNAAKKREQIAAMRDVINEIVAQRKEMHEKTMLMNQEMSAHMMQHMKKGMNEDAMKHMGNCPMMKQMQGKTDNPDPMQE